MTDHGNPSVRRRRLAAELKRLREERNLTGDEVASTLRWSTSKVSRIENSRTGIKPADLGKLLAVYGVSGTHKEELLDLAREPRRKGWWEAYSDVLPEWYAGYVIIESEAEAILCWSPEIVTGLLQTEDYAFAVSDTQGSSANSPGEVSRRVQARLRRQHLLGGDHPIQGTFVLDESVLLRRQGSSATMRGQLARLLELAARPNIAILVLPLASASHPVTVGGGFLLLQFPPVPGIGPASDVVYIEQYAKSALYVEDEAETYQYRRAFEHIVEESLSADESAELIQRVSREIWS